MKRLMISGFAAVALLAAATTMLWSHSLSTGRHVGAADMTSLQEHPHLGRHKQAPDREL